MVKRLFFLFSVLAAPIISGAQQAADAFDAATTGGNLAEAKSILDKALAAEPGRYDLLWRQSRLMILMGESRTGQPDELSYYNKALEIANNAIKANKKGSAGYVRRAAANGKLALFQGVLTSNTFVNAVKEDCERAIKNKADGDITLAAAHYILGRTHLKLNETPVVLRMPLDLDWGNLEEALVHLKKATELRPGFAMYHLEFARALKENDDTAAARTELAKVAAAALQEPGDEQRKKDAADLLKSL